MKTTRSLRRIGAALALTALLGLPGCSAADNLLDVNNPEEIPEDQLDDAKLVGVLVNGVVGDFQSMFDDPFIWRGSMFTDEQISAINWEQTARLNQRVIQFTEGDADIMFSDLSQARAQADSVSGRLRTLLENPQQDERLAKTLNFAGYSYIALADAMCEATINIGDTIYQPLELYQFAVDRFTEALQIAQAAGSETMANLARVGLSRAQLNLGNDAEVIQYASEVPEDFTYWLEYSANSEREENILEVRTTGTNHALGMHPHFLQGPFGEQGLVETQTDPRIQHTPDWSLGHNVLTKVYKPKQPWSYSEFNGEALAFGGEAPGFTKDTDIKLASGLEARHNLHEALGPTAETLAFVNERRDFGNQDPVNLSGDALMDELREQRGRDLFLAGHRLGDLRRWLREGDDLFPSGPHPTEQWGNYGDATCFPLPVEEYEGNPNIPRP